jgi:hypothetical protein
MKNKLLLIFITLIIIKMSKGNELQNEKLLVESKKEKNRYERIYYNGTNFERGYRLNGFVFSTNIRYFPTGPINISKSIDLCHEIKQDFINEKLTCNDYFCSNNSEIHEKNDKFHTFCIFCESFMNEVFSPFDENNFSCKFINFKK